MTDARALAAAKEIYAAVEDVYGSDGLTLGTLDSWAAIITRHFEAEREAVRELKEAAAGYVDAGLLAPGFVKKERRFRAALKALQQVQSLSAPNPAQPEGVSTTPSPASPQWIPVAERLPEFEQPVFGIIKWATGERMAIVMRGDGDDGWLWHICTDTQVDLADDTYVDFECDDDYNVTHWMPLPAPPERGEP